jgi:hypothetical protein
VIAKNRNQKIRSGAQWRRSNREEANHLKAMELLNEMVSEPYHLLHFLAFFSYFVIRTSAAQILSPQITHLLFLREIQAALALGVFAAIKVSIYFFNFTQIPVAFYFIC